MYFQFWRPPCYFRLSAIVAITWRHFIRPRHRRKFWTCCWKFHGTCCSSGGITTSGFGGHITISGGLYINLLKLSASSAWSKTPGLSSELYWYLSYCRRYNYFRFGWLYCYFRLSIIVAITWRHYIRARHGRKSGTCRWNFDAICCSSGGITTSGFGAISLFPVVDRCHRHLLTLSSSSPWSKISGLPSELQWFMSYCRRYKYFRFGWPHTCYFRLSVNVGLICAHFLWVVEDCLPR